MNVPRIELNIPVLECADILAAVHSRVLKPPILSQSASALLSATQRSYAIVPPINVLLGGGLKPGHILELSGPPGSPKERMVIATVKSTVQNGDGVAFIGTRDSSVLFATLADVTLY